MLFSALRRSFRERLSTDRSTREIIVPAALFEEILRSALVGVAVDEAWYLDTYPDVKAAVDSGQVASGKQHFVERGYFEDRLPFPVEIDEAFYLGANPDIRAAYERGEVTSPQQHFEKIGFREGRQPSGGFRLWTQDRPLR